MRFHIPKPSPPAPKPIAVSPETELILWALQQGKIARPKPMPPVRRPPPR